MAGGGGEMTTDAELNRIVTMWGTHRGVDAQPKHVVWEAANGARPPQTAAPGCECVRCETYRAGGDAEDADVAEWAVELLARLHPAERWTRAYDLHAAWTDPEIGCRLPGPDQLVALAKKVPGARRDRPGPAGERLPVEEARRVPILDLVQRLGLGEPERVGREYRVRCFLHDDTKPSLRLNPDKGEGGLWWCDVCAMGGDGISLVERVTGKTFAEAVKEIAA